MSRDFSFQAAVAGIRTRFAPPFSQPQQPVWRWLWFLLAAGFILRWGLSANADWSVRTDEHIQYLEQAHRVVFGYGLIPWEYRLGVRNWMISAPAIAVLSLCKALGWSHPDYYIPVMKAAHCAWSLLLPLGMYFFTRRQYGETAARIALFAGLLWWELLVYASRPLAEHYATLFIFAALSLASPRAGVARALAGGFLFGLALAFRLPYAPVVGIFGLAWLFVLPRRNAIFLFSGGVLALLLWGAVDAITWGGWWQSFVNYLTAKKFHAATVDPAYNVPGTRYIEFITRNSLGVFPLVLVIACFRFRKHWLVLAAAGSVLLLHLPYEHAEHSNIFVLIPLLLCLTAALVADFFTAGKKFILRYKRIITGTTVAGILLLLFVFAKPALIASQRLFNSQDPFFAAAQFISRLPATDVRSIIYLCGDPYVGGGYYHLHHNVPVLSPTYPGHAELITQDYRHIASHLIVCQPSRIEGFFPVLTSDTIQVYANENISAVTPPRGFVYDVYHPNWIRFEKHLLDNQLIENPRPPTPFMQP